jgi:hypothetical protein
MASSILPKTVLTLPRRAKAALSILLLELPGGSVGGVEDFDSNIVAVEGRSELGVMGMEIANDFFERISGSLLGADQAPDQ